MTINEYQKEAMRTAGTNNVDDLLINGVMGLCGESGEAIDIVKKWQYQGHPLDTEHLISELGDVAWYLAVACTGIGVTLEYVLQENKRKLRARYPDGFDAEKSQHRKEGDQ